MNTGIIILAAGESSRMGEPKQLLAYHGTTLLQYTIATALLVPCAPVVVVLGAHAAQIRRQIGDACVLIAENRDWHEGMGSSLRTGLRELLDAQPDTDAVIFLLCDQPLLTPETLRKLIAEHEQTGSMIVASEYDGTLGVPALFTRAFYPELLALEGADGARKIIWTHRAHAIGVPFSEGAVDIDTPADYARLKNSPSELSTLHAA
jgi:molybdenum cofactor cytidylyltransferase